MKYITENLNEKELNKFLEYVGEYIGGINYQIIEDDYSEDYFVMFNSVDFAEDKILNGYFEGGY
jgi:hypothetical protein